MAAMQVETFECSETMAETPEMTAEALALIDQLGLEGQRALIADKEDGDGDGVRNPYPAATAEQAYVVGVLCPEHAELGRYSRSPIPLRVLQVAAHARELGCFSRLEVWDHADATTADPFLVGRIGSEFSGTLHLLARWGEELENWTQLSRRAGLAAIDRASVHLHRILQEVQSHLAMTLQLTPEQAVASQLGVSPHWYK